MQIDPGFYIAAGGAAAQQNWTHIQNAIQDEKFQVSITDRTETLGLLSIQGPKRQVCYSFNICWCSIFE